MQNEYEGELSSELTAEDLWADFNSAVGLAEKGAVIVKTEQLGFGDLAQQMCETL